jgi:hypothetical protein
MEAQSFTYDESQELNENKFTRKAFNFSGWNTESN